MKKVLIAYFSLAGSTEKMAQFVAEGVRFAGQQPIVKKVTDIQTSADLEGYDGYIFGCPTYYLDVAEPMKRFLFLGRKVNLEGKLGGAFGSYTHDGSAPKIVFDTMQYVFKMEPFELGPFNLREPSVENNEGMRACQDYGRAFAERLASSKG